MRVRAFIPLMCAAFALAACASGRHAGEGKATTPSDGSVAIVGATVLPMDGQAGAIEDAVVVLAGDRIVAVGRRDQVRVPAGARRVDGTGRFLVPGLVDMHVHLSPDAGERGGSNWRQLALMVANGITTARSMAGHPSHPVLRDAILAEDRLAPTLYVAAPAVHSGNTPDAAAAIDKAARARTDGFDLVKAHHIEDPVVWRALQEAAREQQLPVGGHLASAIPLEEALRARQQVEHLDGYLAALLPEGSPMRQVAFGQVPPPAVMQAVDRGRIPALAARVAESGAWNVPTLSLFEKIADTTSPTAELRTGPEMQYVLPEALEQWAQRRDQLNSSGLMQAIGEDFVATRRAIVQALDAAGAGIMAGSDTPQDFHLSGFALHEELEALQRAGLSPTAALATATRNPRAYLETLPRNGSARDRAADFGIIARGQRADLLLLREDPRNDVAATRAIDMVVLRGQMLDRGRLDGLLDEVAASVENATTAAASAGQVVLLRHAEVASHGTDPELSAKGRERATAAAVRLAGFAPQAVYATPTRRARQTAEAIAGATGAKVVEYDPANLAGLAADLRSRGGNAVVVGHSNTTPALVRLLGGTAGPAIPEDEFDREYLVSLANGKTRMARPSHAGAVIEDCALQGVAPPVRCGTIQVPETDAADARQLTIHFAVLGATGEARLPPMVFAPGGPGLGGVQTAAGTAQLYATFRESRDILLMDQRGTGASNRLDCALPTDLASAFGSLAEQSDAEIVACRDALQAHADLGAYTTPAAVRDLERIREAIGAPVIDIFGMSYGTRIAADYARQFPGHLRAMVIRSPAPVAMQLPLHTPRDAQDSLDRVVAACRAQPRCAAAYPDVAGDFRKVVARLDAGPVPVHVVDPRNGQGVDTEFTRDAFSSAMFFLLYIPEYYRELPMLLSAAARGNFNPLVQRLAPLVVGTLDQVAWGLRWSVICGEDVNRIDRGSVAGLVAGTFFGSTPIDGDGAACALWPKPRIDPGYFEPLRSSHPTLLISGTMDPVAPPRWGERMLQTLDNAVHLPMEGASHLPVFPGCTESLTLAFLEEASFEGLDMRCAGKPTTPDFAVPAGA